MNDSTDSPQDPDNPDRWLLFIHHLPPKPDYFRVKVRRRLQGIGAAQLKASVYVLPFSDESMEDLQWLLRLVVDEGGEAMLFVASAVAGVSDEEVQAMFRTQSDAEYAEIEEAARAAAAVPAESEVARLKRRLAAVSARDFFHAAGRARAVREVRAVEAAFERSRRAGEALSSATTPSDRAVAGGELSRRRPDEPPRGAVWVTRKGVHVDRIASAWLIRRFVDAGARFRFVEAKGFRPQPGELRFDMYEGEYTHEGDACTFEVLISRFVPDDPALVAIGEIVHDIDFKEATFGREEVAGVASLIRGICAFHDEDVARIDAGTDLFDGLYASLSRE